jgi:hypothetical protein
MFGSRQPCHRVLVAHTKTCDGPSEDSIRRAATANGLPIDSICEVRVLDPYFYLTPTS